MILRRKGALATLERVMEKFFANGPTDLDLQYLVEFLTFLLERDKTPLISEVFAEKKYRIKRVAQFIKLARTKAEAMELVKINYMPFLFLPEDDPVLSVLLDLDALSEALQTPMR